MRMSLRTAVGALPYVLQKYFAHSKRKHVEHLLSLLSSGGR
jgi:hypothetical protein